MPSLTPLLALTTVLFAAFLPAQQPTIVHAQFTTESASQGLSPRIVDLERSGAPVWVGYSIPVTPGFNKIDDESHPALLEDKSGEQYHTHDETQSTAIDHVTVLLRLANSTIEKIRVENSTRTLDAGNLRFVWLTDVSEVESLRTMTEAARMQGKDGVASSAVFVIAIHRSPEATKALISLAAPASPLGLRDKAAFWLANQRGKEGLDADLSFAREDTDPEFRKKLTFDLTLTKEPGGLEEIIRMAHSDASPDVRKQAQFWMAVKGGKKVAGDLRGLAENDPDTQLRKSAVFALSRLPNEEAATQLIQVASTSKDPAVRKQAVFWLGQSQDPRALDYLTTLLK
jgi:HEAT repeat protein